MRINVKKYGIFCLCMVFFIGCGQNSSSLGMHKNRNKHLEDQRWWRKEAQIQMESRRCLNRAPQKMLTEKPQWMLEPPERILNKEPQWMFSSMPQGKKFLILCMLLTSPLLLQGTPFDDYSRNSSDVAIIDPCSHHTEFFKLIKSRKKEIKAQEQLMLREGCKDVALSDIKTCTFKVNYLIEKGKEICQDTMFMYDVNPNDRMFHALPVNENNLIISGNNITLDREYSLTQDCNGESKMYIWTEHKNDCFDEECDLLSISHKSPQNLRKEACRIEDLDKREKRFFEIFFKMIANQNHLLELCSDFKSNLPTRIMLQIAEEFLYGAKGINTIRNHENIKTILEESQGKTMEDNSKVTSEIKNITLGSPKYIELSDRLWAIWKKSDIVREAIQMHNSSYKDVIAGAVKKQSEENHRFQQGLQKELNNLQETGKSLNESAVSFKKNNDVYGQHNINHSENNVNQEKNIENLRKIVEILQNLTRTCEEERKACQEKRAKLVANQRNTENDDLMSKGMNLSSPIEALTLENKEEDNSTVSENTQTAGGQSFVSNITCEERIHSLEQERKKEKEACDQDKGRNHSELSDQEVYDLCRGRLSYNQVYYLSKRLTVRDGISSLFGKK